MKQRLSVLALGAALSAVATGEADASALLVPEDFGSIQEALDASASGDEIYLGNEIYAEQIFIDGIDVTLYGSETSTIMAPEGLMGPMIHVMNGGILRISDVVLDGASRGSSEDFIGIHVAGSALVMRGVDVQNMETLGCNDCQTGVAVLAETDMDGMPSYADIVHSTFTNYQKGAVVARGEDTLVRVRDTAFNGGGSTDLIARNGVQISDGATGSIAYSSFKGHYHTDYGWFASGVLLENAREVDVHHNMFLENQVGVYNVTSDGTWIYRNRLRDPSGLDFDYGIILWPYQSPHTETGVWVTRNYIRNVSVGIYVAADDEEARIARNLLINSVFWTGSDSTVAGLNWTVMDGEGKQPAGKPVAAEGQFGAPSLYY